MTKGGVPASGGVSTATAPRARDCVRLLGVPIDRVDPADLDDRIEAVLAGRAPQQVVTANLDFLALARRRPAFAAVLQAADLVLCDGKPLQWAARVAGTPIPARLTGTDLVLRTARLSAIRGYRIFLLGAADGVARDAARALESQFPGVAIAGVCAPPYGPFDAAEDARIVANVRAARADALFVALGAPRQEEWIHAHLGELGVPLCAGVGAVFDFLAGRVRRAPGWMQRAGLEWAFRLTREPARLWRRYLLDDLPVLFALLARPLARPLARHFARRGRTPAAGHEPPHGTP